MRTLLAALVRLRPIKDGGLSHKEKASCFLGLSKAKGVPIHFHAKKGVGWVFMNRGLKG